MSASLAAKKPASKAADKPVSKAAEPKPISTSQSTTTEKKKVKTYAAKSKTAKPAKPTATKAKAKAAASKTESGRPSWKDIIKECIAAHPDEARSGVSRSTIKKFAEEKYKIEVTGLNLSQLNRAIASGAESGVFALPKGPSGKVKLAPKTKKAETTNENVKPASKTTTSKPAAKSVTKAVPAKKPAAKAATTTLPPLPPRKRPPSRRRRLQGSPKLLHRPPRRLL